MTRSADVRDAFTDVFTSWLAKHNDFLPATCRDAIKESFAAWLELNREALILAIAEAIARNHEHFPL